MATENKKQSGIVTNRFWNQMAVAFGFEKIDKKDEGPQKINKGLDGSKKVDSNIRLTTNDTSDFSDYKSLMNLTSRRMDNPKVEEAFLKYCEDNTISYEKVQDRMARMNSLDYMWFNDDYVSMATNTIADETTQLDKQGHIFTVSSKNKVYTHQIYKKLNDLGVDIDLVWQFAFDLWLFGETFYGIEYDAQNHISKVVYLGPKMITEVLAFNYMQYTSYINSKKGQSLASHKNLIQNIHDYYEAQDGSLSMESAVNRTYVFGYMVGDTYLPPWSVCHIKLGKHSEFFPYGRPPMLNALAPFKQAMTATAFEELQRANSFPIQVFKVKVSEGLGAAQSSFLVNEAREEFDNIGVTPQTTGDETYGQNTQIWLPEGLISTEFIVPNNGTPNTQYTEDIKLFSDRVARAVGVPRTYFDTTAEGAQLSGVALVELHKPVARSVFKIQSAILNSIYKTLRLAFRLEGNCEDFYLSMRFPADALSSDHSGSMSTQLSLVTSIIDTLKSGLGVEGNLPVAVIKDLLTNFTFLDDKEVSRWLRLFAAQADEAMDAEDMDGDTGDASGGSDDFFGGGDDGGGDMFGGDDGAAAEAPADDGTTEESYSSVIRRRNKNLKIYQENVKLEELRKTIIRRTMDDGGIGMLCEAYMEEGQSDATIPGFGHAYISNKNTNDEIENIYGLYEAIHHSQKISDEDLKLRPNAYGKDYTKKKKLLRKSYIWN